MSNINYSTDIYNYNSDLNLLNYFGIEDLDVYYVRGKNPEVPAGATLVQLTFRQKIWNKIVEIFSCFSNQLRKEKADRLYRLQGYVHLAAEKILSSNPSESLRTFYSHLRKWGFLDNQTQRKVDEYFQSQILSSKNQEYLRRKQDYETCESPDERSRKKELMNRSHWEYIYALSDFANKMGVSTQSVGKGVHGAQFGRDLSQRPITVIKTHAKDPRLINEALLPLQRSQEEICKHDPRKAEVVAFKLSEFFGFDIVPVTYTNDEGHSVQLYEGEGIEAGQADIAQREVDEDELEQLQLMAIFNYLSGDLDGKDDNWKIKFDENGKIVGIVKFDNGNTFPHETLRRKNDALTLPKTYAWKRHNWAKRPLQPRPGSKLEGLLNLLGDRSKIIEFEVMIENLFEGFWSPERIKLMHERLGTIHAVRHMKLSLSHLGEIYGSEVHSETDTITMRLIENYRNHFLGYPQQTPRPPAALLAQQGEDPFEAEEEIVLASTNVENQMSDEGVSFFPPIKHIFSTVGNTFSSMGNWAFATMNDWIPE